MIIFVRGKRRRRSRNALSAPFCRKVACLVTADLVANQNYVELERAESGEKTAANVAVVDYEANLALLEPTDKKFLDGLTRSISRSTRSWAIGLPPGNSNRPARSS